MQALFWHFQEVPFEEYGSAGVPFYIQDTEIYFAMVLFVCFLIKEVFFECFLLRLVNSTSTFQMQIACHTSSLS